MKGISIGIGAKDAGFQSTIKNVNKSVGGMDKHVQAAAKSVSMSFGKMVKAGAALALGFGAIKLAAGAAKKVVSSFGDAIDMGGRLNDLSSRTGETAGNLLILERAFQNSGAGADKVGGTINKMQRAIVEAGQGITTYKRAFDSLGISLEDLKKKSPTEQLSTLAERLAAMPNDTDRAAVAMQILGRSGGELIPLFRNFSGEIDRAGSELGTLPDIMNKQNVAFDAVADRLAAIRDKFKEFAAGILDRVLPALELVVEGLSKIDAAALGQKLADFFIGGQEAMKGFSDSLAAFRMGDFTLGIKIAFESIKLQAASSINSIYSKVRGAVAAAISLIKSSFGPGTAVWKTILAAYKVLTSKLAIGLGEAIKPLIQSIPGYGEKAARELDLHITSLSISAKVAAAEMKRDMADVPAELEAGLKGAQEEFNRVQKGADGLIDTAGAEAKIQQLKLELIEKQAAAEKERANAVKKSASDEKSLIQGISEQRIQSVESIKKIEADIADAKAMGDEEQVRQLEARKSYEEQFLRSLDRGKTLQEAIADAAKAYDHSLLKSVSSEKKITKEKQKQLGLSDKILKQLKEARIGEAIDPAGKLEGRARREIELGQWKRAERTLKRIKDKEIEADLRGAGADRDRRNIRDIAKAEGVDTFKKSRQQIRDDILKKRQRELELGNQGKDNKQIEKELMAKKVAKPAKTPMDKLADGVDDIKRLVAQIEPKLPQHALT